MKAAVLHEVGNPLRIEDVPIPEMGPDDVLVETKACGICRTDLHIYNGLAYVPQLPHILGHEPAGIVAKVGQNVSGFSIGQRVVPHLFFTCGNCYYCRVGLDAQCINLTGLLGVLNDGALQNTSLPLRKTYLLYLTKFPLKLAVYQVALQLPLSMRLERQD